MRLVQRPTADVCGPCVQCTASVCVVSARMLPDASGCAVWTAAGGQRAPSAQCTCKYTFDNEWNNTNDFSYDLRNTYLLMLRCK